MTITTTDSAALFEMDQRLIRQEKEITLLRQYRKRAKRAYRTLQAAHERVSGAYGELYRAHLDLRRECYSPAVNGE